MWFSSGTDDLDMKHVSDCFVPKLLSTDQMATQVLVAQDIFGCVSNDDNF